MLAWYGAADGIWSRIQQQQFGDCQSAQAQFPASLVTMFFNDDTLVDDSALMHIDNAPLSYSVKRATFGPNIVGDDPHIKEAIKSSGSVDLENSTARPNSSFMHPGYAYSL